MEFTPNNRFLIIRFDDGSAGIWRTDTGKKIDVYGDRQPRLDGRLLATGAGVHLTASADGRASLWSARTGTLLHRLDGHSEAISAGAISRDGQIVVTASSDGTTVFWSAVTGETLRTVRIDPTPVTSLDISADGRIAAVGLGNASALFVGLDRDEVQPGIYRPSISDDLAEPDVTTQVSLSNDGSVLLAKFYSHGVDFGDDARVVWDTRQQRTLLSAPGVVCQLSPDGTTFAYAGRGNDIGLWPLDGAGAQRVLKGHESLVKYMAFSADGDVLVTASPGNRTARVWDVEEGREISVVDVGHRDYGLGEPSVVVADSGRTLATWMGSGSLHLWDTGSGRLLRTFSTSGAIERVEFDADETLVSVGTAGGVQTWQVHDGTEVSSFVSGAAHLKEAVVSDDIAVKDGLDRVHVLDIATGERLHTFSGTWPGRSGLVVGEGGRRLALALGDDRGIGILHAYGNGAAVTLQGSESDDVDDGMFGDDGRLYGSGFAGGGIEIWETETGTKLRSIEVQSEERPEWTFSPDGTRVGAIWRGGAAGIWNVRTGERLHTLETPDCCGVYFGPDGKVLFAGGWMGWKVVETESASELATFDQGLQELVVSSSGSIAASSAGGSVLFWDTSDWTLLNRDIREIEKQKSAHVSPDGRTMVTASSDDRLWFWDVRTGQRRFVRRSEHYGAGRLSFGPDGDSVIVASHEPGGEDRPGDVTTAIWDVRTGEKRASIKGDPHFVALEGDSRMLILDTGEYSMSGEISVWDLESLGVTHRVSIDVHEYFSWFASPDLRFVGISADEDDAALWDVETGILALDINGLSCMRSNPDNLSSPDGLRKGFSATGSALVCEPPVYLYSGAEASVREGETGRVLLSFDWERWEQSDNVRVVIPLSGETMVVTWQSGFEVWDPGSGTANVTREFDGLCSSVVVSSDGRNIAGGFVDGTVRVWDTATGSERYRVEGLAPQGCGGADAVMGVAISDDGRDGFWYAFGKEGDGVRSVASRLDMKSGRVLWRTGDFHEAVRMKPSRWGSLGAAFSPKGGMVSILGRNAGVVLDVRSGDIVWNEGGEWFSEGETMIGSPARSEESGGRGSRRVKVVDTTIDGAAGDGTERRVGSFSGLNIAAEGGIVAGVVEGRVRYWEAETGRVRGEIFVFGDDEWLITTPEGFFSSSERGANYLSLVRGRDALSVDQVYGALYRPDLVSEALKGDPEGSVAGAAAKLDLAKVVESGLPPRIVGLTSVEGDAVDADMVEVLAEMEVSSGGIGRVEWRVNGIVQGADSRGLSRSEEQRTADVVQRLKKKVFLVPGENVISVIAYNRANLIASDPEEIVVVSAWADAGKPKLHVLSAGVNDYFDSNLALAFATSDARAVGRALKRAGREFYEGVDVTYLLDENVSAQGLEAAFAKLRTEVRPQDVFVFFLAGHGKTVDGRYYFLPRDFRFRGMDDLTTTAISQEQLQRWISQIPAQKSVLFLDTCESGSLTKEFVTRGLQRKTAIDRLSRAVGRTVLTASTDTQPALEGFRQHGLFTYTLLEAFAMADSDGDNEVEINELIGYVDERLPELSEAAFGFRQVPQFKSRGNIFPLGRPVEFVSTTERLIPRSPTHVVIREAEVLEDYNDAGSVIDTYVPGVAVRVLERSGAWTLIAIDGVSIGWTQTARLATLQK